MATFQARYGYNSFFKLRNSNRENKVITLHLKTQLFKNGEHIRQKVAKSCKLNILILFEMNFARPLISALLEEVLKCFM